MMQYILISRTITLVLLLFSLSGLAQVRVSGYRRSNGTYVRPYIRTAPDWRKDNNYSYPGNYNPNSGEITPGGSNGYSGSESINAISNGKNDEGSTLLNTLSDKEFKILSRSTEKWKMEQSYKDKKDSLARLGIKKYKHWIGEVCIIKGNVFDDTKSLSGYSQLVILYNGPSFEYSTISTNSSDRSIRGGDYVEIVEISKNGWIKIRASVESSWHDNYIFGYIESRYLY